MQIHFISHNIALSPVYMWLWNKHNSFSSFLLIVICIQNKCIKCIISIYSIVEKQDLKPAGIDQQLIFISGYEMFVGIIESSNS